MAVNLNNYKLAKKAGAIRTKKLTHDAVEVTSPSFDTFTGVKTEAVETVSISAIEGEYTRIHEQLETVGEFLTDLKAAEYAKAEEATYVAPAAEAKQ